MEQPNVSTLVSFFKALAHQSRLQILGYLAESEHSVRELAENLKLKEPTISHHLAMLSELDLVTMRQDGTTHYYRLNTQTLERVNKDLLTREKVATLNDDGGVDWEEKVRRTFLDGERLLKFPASYKKWLVLLKWLADKFAFDYRYTEKEVNALIKNHHEDYASIRRDLVEHGYMTRENGIYWRLSAEATAARLDELRKHKREM